MCAPQNICTLIGYKLMLIQVLFLNINLKSQDYLPTLRDNAVWTVGRGQGMGSYSFFDIRLSCDSTLLDDKYYRLVHINAIDYDCAPELGYVREDNEEKRVYYRSSLEDSPLFTEEVLIADYSLSIGDSISVYGWGSVLYVDTIYMKTWFDGQEYKYFQMDNPHFSYYEGLGSQLYGVVPECHVYCFLFDYELEGESCDTEVSVSEEDGIFEVKCFPNPVSGLLKISQISTNVQEEIEIEVRNLEGRVYYTDSFIGESHDIDTEQFPTGVFIISFYKQGQLLGHKRFSHL